MTSFALESEKLVSTKAPPFGIVGSVADVVLIEATIFDSAVPPPGFKAILPNTSQSPAVKLIDVTFAVVLVVKETAEPTKIVLSMNSPTYPDAALSLVLVPLIEIPAVRVIFPSVSPKTISEFCVTVPPVELQRTNALSVEEPGPVRVPAPAAAHDGTPEASS